MLIRAEPFIYIDRIAKSCRTGFIQTGITRTGALHERYGFRSWCLG